MKTSLPAALLLGSTKAQAQVDGVFRDAVDIAKGFLEGAVAAEGLDDISLCIEGSKQLIADSEATYADCKDGNIFQKAKCIKDISGVIRDVIGATQSCENLEGDFERIKAMAEVFANPSSIFWHVGTDIFVNHVEIGADIDAAMTSYEAKEWEDFGKRIGDASAKVLIGGEMPLGAPQQHFNFGKEQYAELMAGIYSAYGVKINVLDLLLCIQDMDESLMVATLGFQAAEDMFSVCGSDTQTCLGDLFTFLFTEWFAVQYAKQQWPECAAIPS